ncbi:hypothetical protein EPR50_G00049580 [Perca flavescens]|uniref:Uncharacterized protein n=1 Tax=Perca flavescens TaxID=8167 RepID=A0A484DDK9_PERFV|nr:hypothetical protein EPR50_G00049580 [Perca flavescens]
MTNPLNGQLWQHKSKTPHVTSYKIAMKGYWQVITSECTVSLDFYRQPRNLSNLTCTVKENSRIALWVCHEIERKSIEVNSY